MLLAAVAIGAICAASAAPALADGDPASDVLATQSVFVPADGNISSSEQQRLTAEVAAAARSGYPVRVAMVATPADLGSVTALWRRPVAYAAYLGEELSLVFHGTLLVVMPDGYGVERIGVASGPTAAALAGSRPPGSAVGAAAIVAVARLATAAGHPVSAPAATARSQRSPGSGSWLASVDLGSWIALLGGALVVAAAWTGSLRARPARRRWRARSTGAAP
ncbi:MAG: hypothetical protein ABSH51_06635 [Solirubrobacteraceae bacterium]